LFGFLYRRKKAHTVHNMIKKSRQLGKRVFLAKYYVKLVEGGSEARARPRFLFISLLSIRKVICFPRILCGRSMYSWPTGKAAPGVIPEWDPDEAAAPTSTKAAYSLTDLAEDLFELVEIVTLSTVELLCLIG